MIHKFIMSVVFVLSLIGHSYVLNAQCKASCSSTTQYNLNEVVICNKEGCGKNGDFSFSRSASLFSTVRFRTEGVPLSPCVGILLHNNEA